MSLLTDQIDAVIAAAQSDLESRQNSYHAAHGRYWQGLDTHSTVPADGATAAPDRLGSRPTDQAETWTAFGFTLPQWKCALRVDVYTGGWVLVIQVREGGALKVREVNFGPESWRERAWTVVEPD